MNTIDICNTALAIVGVDRGIESLDDDCPEARYCRRLYPQARQLLLRDHPWRWAARREAGALLSDEVDGWDYVYAYPSDCIKLLAVEDVEPAAGMIYEWEMRSISGVVVGVCCDVETAYLRYTKDVEDANLFDSAFIEALAVHLARKLSVSLTGNTTLAQSLDGEAARTLGRAKFLDASENEREPYHSNRYVDARTA